MSAILAIIASAISLLAGWVAARNSTASSVTGEAAQRGADDAQTLKDVADAEKIREDVGHMSDDAVMRELRANFERDSAAAKSKP